MEERKRRLINAINNSHYSGKELADLINVSPSQITNYKKGVYFPHTNTLIKLCSILDVSPSYVLCETDDPNVFSDSDFLPPKSIDSQLENVNSSGKEIIYHLYSNFMHSVDFISKMQEFQNNTHSNDINKSSANTDSSNNNATISSDYKQQKSLSKVTKEEKEEFIARPNTVSHTLWQKYFDEQKGIKKGKKSKVHVEMKAAAGFEEVMMVDYETISYNAPHFFDLAIEIEGNSMEPIFHNREIIFAKRTNYLDNGNYGIFKLEDKYLFKKFVTNYSDKYILRSINANYDDIDLTKYDPEQFHVIAKIIL